MLTMNKIQVIGHLCADPQRRDTPKGQKICTFRVGTNYKRGEREENTFFNVVTWNQLADLCHTHLSRGDLVYIDGRFHSYQYEKEDYLYEKSEIIADTVLWLYKTQPMNDLKAINEPILSEEEKPENDPSRDSSRVEKETVPTPESKAKTASK